VEEAQHLFHATNVRKFNFLKLDFVSVLMSNMEYAFLAMPKKKSKLYQKALAVFMVLEIVLMLETV
jgi:hypothetical protein